LVFTEVLEQTWPEVTRKVEKTADYADVTDQKKSGVTAPHSKTSVLSV